MSSDASRRKEGISLDISTSKSLLFVVEEVDVELVKGRDEIGGGIGVGIVVVVVVGGGGVGGGGVGSISISVIPSS